MKATTVLALLFACFHVAPLSAVAIQTVADLDDLEALVDVVWTNSTLAKIMPPDNLPYNNLLGFIGYEIGFDTTFLASLTAVTNGVGTNLFSFYRVKVIEEINGSDRIRCYYSVGSTNSLAVHTTTVSIANYPEDWITDNYGDEPDWLRGPAVQEWRDARDPSRQHLCYSLIATGSISSYVAMLTNSTGPYFSVQTPPGLRAAYSNEIVFVEIRGNSSSTDIYLHAPTNVLTIDLFKSTNLVDKTGWSLPATLDHVMDPLLWSYVDNDTRAFFSGGNAAIDTDSDGVGDGREVRMFGTSPYLADSDGDGLTDGEEIMTFSINPLSADTDGDGIPDEVEVAIGTSAGSADSDGDGITDYGEIYTYFKYVDPMDADTDDDGLDDYAEVITHGTYASPDISAARDTDGDNLSDYDEVVTHSTNPLSVDSDGDGIDDGYEEDKDWDPNDAGDATDDADGDGFDNVTEYKWCTNPTSSGGYPSYQRLITRGPGTNAIHQMDTINRQLIAGDLGSYSSLVRIRPYEVGTNLVPQRLHHTQAAGIYINGTEASTISTPIGIAASSNAVEFLITADASAAGTNIYFELTDTNDSSGLSCTATFYVPQMDRVEFSGPGSVDVDVDYGETNVLWVGMPADTNACRIYMDPDQTPNQGYGIPYFHWTDWALVKASGVGATPSTTTLNALDWKSAYGTSYSSAYTRGIRLDPGSYTFQVGYDFNADASLDLSEVQETCVIHAIKIEFITAYSNCTDISYYFGDNPGYSGALQSTSLYAFVEAYTDPSVSGENLPSGFITWTGGEEVPGNQLLRKVSLADTAKHTLTASCGGHAATGVVYSVWCDGTGFSPSAPGQSWVTNDYHFVDNNASWTPAGGTGLAPADSLTGEAQNNCEIQFTVYPTNMVSDGALGLFDTNNVRFDVRRDKKRISWYRTETNFYEYVICQSNNWESDDYGVFSLSDEDNNPWDSSAGHLYGNDYPGFLPDWFTNHPAYDEELAGGIFNSFVPGVDPPDNGAIQKLNMREWVRCEFDPPAVDPTLKTTLDDASSDGTLASDPYYWHSFVGIVSNGPSGWIRAPAAVSENEITVNGTPISWGTIPP